MLANDDLGFYFTGGGYHIEHCIASTLCGKPPARGHAIYIAYSPHNLQYLGGHRYNNFSCGADDARDTTTTKSSSSKHNRLKSCPVPVAESCKNVAADTFIMKWSGEIKVTTNIDPQMQQLMHVEANNLDQAGSSLIGDDARVFSNWTTMWELKRTWLLFEVTTNRTPEHNLLYIW